MTEQQTPTAKQSIRDFEWKDFWAVYIVMVNACEEGDKETIRECIFLQQALLAHLAPQAWIDFGLRRTNSSAPRSIISRRRRPNQTRFNLKK